MDDPLTRLPADGNPLAVCELGGAMPRPAQVKRVKVLGSLAVINENKTDWKVFVVDLENPEADKLSDIGDVESVMPGYLDTIKEWFRVYKLAEGKEENVLGANGELQNQKYGISL
jgi:inorganic pyrophosphatase